MGVLLMVSKEFKRMASSRCSITTYRKNQPRLGILGPKTASVPFAPWSTLPGTRHICDMGRRIEENLSIVSLLERVFGLRSKPTQGLKLEMDLHITHDTWWWNRAGITKYEKSSRDKTIHSSPHGPKFRFCSESCIERKHFSINKMSFSKLRRVMHREALKIGLGFCPSSASSCLWVFPVLLITQCQKSKVQEDTIQETRTQWPFFFFLERNLRVIAWTTIQQLKKYPKHYWYIKELGWISRELCWVKKNNPKRVHLDDSIYIKSLKW